MDGGVRLRRVNVGVCFRVYAPQRKFLYTELHVMLKRLLAVHLILPD